MENVLPEPEVKNGAVLLEAEQVQKGAVLPEAEQVAKGAVPAALAMTLIGQVACTPELT